MSSYFLLRLEFTMQPSHAPTLARQPSPQTTFGNESFPDANLLCWPSPVFDEQRFRGPSGNLPEPVDGPRRYLPPVVQSHLPDSRAWTSHRLVVGRLQ